MVLKEPLKHFNKPILFLYIKCVNSKKCFELFECFSTLYLKFNNSIFKILSRVFLFNQSFSEEASSVILLVFSGTWLMYLNFLA